MLHMMCVICYVTHVCVCVCVCVWVRGCVYVTRGGRMMFHAKIPTCAGDLRESHVLRQTEKQFTNRTRWHSVHLVHT